MFVTYRRQVSLLKDSYHLAAKDTLCRQISNIKVFRAPGPRLDKKMPKNGLTIFPEFHQKCSKNLRYHL